MAISTSELISPTELDRWVAGLREGYATTEALPRFIESYKAMWLELFGKELPVGPDRPGLTDPRQLSFLDAIDSKP